MNIITLLLPFSLCAFDEIRPRALYLGAQVRQNFMIGVEKLKVNLKKAQKIFFDKFEVAKEKLIQVRDNLSSVNIKPGEMKQEIEKLLEKSKQVEVDKDVKNEIIKKERESSEETSSGRVPVEQL